MEWMILPLKRYADFQGRSRRKEYWMFVLFNFIVQIALGVVDSIIGLGGHTSTYSSAVNGGFAAGAMTSGGILANVYSVAVLIPTIAVGVRRLHDIDRTGWWLLAPAVAIFGGSIPAVLSIRSGNGLGAQGIVGGLLILVGGVIVITLFVWSLLDGTRGPNRFGPDPKSGINDLQETFR